MPYLGNVPSSFNVGTANIDNGAVTGDKLSTPFDYDSGTLYLDNTNNRVGIGTTSPADILHLSNAGNLYIRVSNTSTGVNGYLGQDSNGTYIGNTGAAAVRFIQGASERIRLDTSGRLLIGTASARSNFFNSTNSSTFQLEGTSNDGSSLTIVQNYPGSTNGSTLVLAKSEGATLGSNTVTPNGTILGSISFQGNDGSQFAEAAFIRCDVGGISGANDMPGTLIFGTTSESSASGTGRLQIVENGRLDLWSVDASAWGQFARMVRFGYGSPYKCLMLGGIETSSYTSISLGYNVSINGSGAFQGDGRDIVVRNNSIFISPNTSDTGFATNIVFNQLGHGTIAFPNGIGFGGDTAAVNILDDYEEGSWTPSLNASGYTFTYPSRDGRYTKIGNCVYIKFYMQVSYSSGSGSVPGRIAGLPFTSANVSANYGGLSIYPDVGSAFFPNVFNLRTNPNSTELAMASGFNSASITSTFNWAALPSSTEFEVSGFYFV